MSDQCEQAIQSVITSENAFCKFLSANDTGATGGHQAGILVSKSAASMMFHESLPKTGILKREVKIAWPDGHETTSRFTYYSSKNELRITSFGRDFPFLRPDQTGSLFIFTQQDYDDYKAYFLDMEDEIDEFLETLSLSPTQTNALISTKPLSQESHEQTLVMLARDLLKQYKEFPSTEQMSTAARNLREKLFHQRKTVCVGMVSVTK